MEEKKLKRVKPTKQNGTALLKKNQLLLTLAQLRLFLNENLADRFSVSKPTCTNVYNKMIRLLFIRLF